MSFTEIRHKYPAMGSVFEIVLDGLDQQNAASVFAAVETETSRIEQKYSRYQESSFLTQINKAAGKTQIVCDAETNLLLSYAKALYDVSEGLFDITSGVLSRAWDFRLGKIPTELDLKRYRSLVAWPEVQWDGKVIYLPREGMEIDFGGFGKEYAVDRAVSILRDFKVSSGYVNFGGDVGVIGPKTSGDPWLMGVQHPRSTGELIATIPVSTGGLASSGDYERFFEKDGRRYCHILNPKTGYPAGYWQSVTVLASQAIIAGSYATTAILMERSGHEFLNASGFDFLAIDGSGVIHQKNPPQSMNLES